MSLDGNRAEDGLSLRARYEDETGYSSMMQNRPCSVLEMMVALAVRCEEDIMTDDVYGDRTPYWFDSMIFSLGLSGMTDPHYDEEYVADILYKFLYRQYGSNGRGGLFTINNPNIDVRSMEIWMQLNWYLNSYI